MPTWLVIALSAIGGLAVVGATVFLALMPELRARPKKSWMAKPSGNDNNQQPIAGIGPE